MPVITDVRFAHEDGALAHTLGHLPDVRARVIRETSTDPGTRRYYVLVEPGRRVRIQAVLDDDPTVREATPLPKFDHQQLWAVEFSPDTKLLAPRVTANGGLVIDARSARPRGGPRGWHERWLLPDLEAIHDVWRRARDDGFAFDVLKLYRGAHTGSAALARDALTEHQRRALATAYERGYFAEPRDASLEALGDALDLSASAVGGRLRRGTKALIGATLVVDGPDGRAGGEGGRRPARAEGAPGPEGGVAHGATTACRIPAPVAPAERAPPRESTTAGVSLDVHVQHPDLALAPTIRTLPGVDVGVVSDASTDPDNDAYFFRVEADDFAAVEAAFDDDHTVASYEPVVETGDRRTYRIEYTDDASLITPAIADMGVLVRESESHADGWLLSLLLQDHDALDRLDRYLDRSTFEYEVVELTRGGVDAGRSPFDLTESQMEALVCAYAQGYYDDPRMVSLAELGSILGLSETAVGGRLRRGAARLIEGILDA